MRVVLVSTGLIVKLFITEIEVETSVNIDVSEMVLRVAVDDPIPVPELVREAGDPVEPEPVALELDRGKGAELGVPETEFGEGENEVYSDELDGAVPFALNPELRVAEKGREL